MTMHKILLAPMAALLLALPAMAQNADIDINGDGMYSLAEIRAALPGFSDDDFDRLDSNNDGLLDAEEIAAGEAEGLLPR